MSISRESIEHKYMFGILFFILAYVSPKNGAQNVFMIIGLIYVVEYILFLVIDFVKEVIRDREKKKAISKAKEEWNKLLNALKESGGKDVKKDD